MKDKIKNALLLNSAHIISGSNKEVLNGNMAIVDVALKEIECFKRET